ncbi:MAG: DUF2258 domain-containing protein [Candidatus Methanomethylicaceae archaeon]
MPIMKTGLTIAGGYADKIRKVIFAQLAEDIKEKRIESKNVAFHVAQLNKFLYVVLVDSLKLNKEDCVRISIEYEIINGSILWKFDTLKIDVFKKVSDEEINPIILKLIAEAEKIIRTPVEYTIEYIGETSDGDKIYNVKVREQEGGIIELLQINEDFIYIKIGVLLIPEPIKIEKIKIPLEGKKLEEILNTSINEILSKGKPILPEEADSILKYIKGRLAS